MARRATSSLPSRAGARGSSRGGEARRRRPAAAGSSRDAPRAATLGASRGPRRRRHDVRRAGRGRGRPPASRGGTREWRRGCRRGRAACLTTWRRLRAVLRFVKALAVVRERAVEKVVDGLSGDRNLPAVLMAVAFVALDANELDFRARGSERGRDALTLGDVHVVVT